MAKVVYCLHRMTTGWDLAVRQLIIIPALLFLAEQSTPPGRLRPWVNCFVTDLFQHYCSSHIEKRVWLNQLIVMDDQNVNACHPHPSKAFRVRTLLTQCPPVAHPSSA